MASSRRIVYQLVAPIERTVGAAEIERMGVERELSKRLGVPVVNPVLAALKTAETLLDLGLSHSRASWPSPPEKAYFE
jgi:allantoin racemase